MLGLALACALSLGALADGTRYQVAEQNGVWRFVSPEGKRFWSLGVCCVNQGIKKAEEDPLNPAYASYRYYADTGAWAKETLARFRSWGVNTVGAWSDHEALRSELAQTPVLHLASSGIPWVDTWDPKVVAETREVARGQIAKWRLDPHVVGYFSDNELGWWAGAMFEWGWKAKEGSGTRSRLVGLVRECFGGEWRRLLEDFDPEGASSFEELSKGGRLYLRPGGNGMRVVRRYMGLVAERYYALCREIVKECDPGALYLGDRFISNYEPDVAQAAGRYVDVVSTNLNADWPNGDLTPYYLDGLYRLTGRPVLITEYYQCAMENRTGNMNDASGFPTVRTQRERERGFLNQTRALLAKPYVVGAHWFQYFDEATHGRPDGENYNMGLVDVWNRPYEGLTRAFRTAAKEATAERFPPPTPERNSLPELDPCDAKLLQNWPRTAAYVPPCGGDPRGDLFVAWNQSGLYVAVYWCEDRFAEAFYRDGRIPSEDRATLTLSVEGLKRPVFAKVGLGGDAEPDGAIALYHSSGVRNCAVFRVPARELGRVRLAAGEKVRFDATLSTRGRAYEVRWKGERALAAGKAPRVAR